MRKQIIDLENQLSEFRSGRLVVSNSGSVVANDLSNENAMLKTDNDKYDNNNNNNNNNVMVYK